MAVLLTMRRSLPLIYLDAMYRAVLGDSWVKKINKKAPDTLFNRIESDSNKTGCMIKIFFGGGVVGGEG